MRTLSHARRGVTLIEVLLAIAIFGVLIGLLLPAIQSARGAVALLENKNNLRQIILATHLLAGEQDGKIANLMHPSMPREATPTDASLLYRLIPYVHGPRTYSPDMTGEQIRDTFEPRDVKVYHNAADPSWDYDPAFADTRAKCTYALNMFALDGKLNPISLRDGASQTIAFADKYFARCSPNSTVSQTYMVFTELFGPYNGEVYGRRRATLADRGWEDVLPVTDQATATTRASVPGKMFQVQPRPEDVDPSIPQAPHAVGLTVALFDGSVRTIAPAVSESVFWGLVTPAGGDLVNLDWRRHIVVQSEERGKRCRDVSEKGPDTVSGLRKACGPAHAFRRYLRACPPTPAAVRRLFAPEVAPLF